MEKDFYPAYFELEGRHWWFLGRRKLFLRLLEQRFPEDRRPIRVLDFGTGTGAFLDDLDRFGPVSAVDGDPSAVSFCHARGRTEVRHAPPGARLPFEDGAFDLVTTLDVIEHIESDVAALAELRRVIRPGATAWVTAPFVWEFHEEPYDFYRYTRHGLRSVLERAGFEAVDVEPFGGCFSTLAQLLRNLGSISGSTGPEAPLARRVLSEGLRRGAPALARLDRWDRRGVLPLGHGAVGRRPA